MADCASRIRPTSYELPRTEEAIKRYGGLVTRTRRRFASLGSASAPTRCGEKRAQQASTNGRMPTVQWIRFLFSFEGRVNRRAYLLRFVLPLLLIEIALAVLVPPLDFNTAMVSLLLVSLWPTIAVGAKRCHDRDRSGWFQLVILVPIVGWLWLMFELCFLRGTSGQNRFGWGTA
jgi:uncharacterized membrane protein YhaH (DUF805 family)